MAVLASVGSLSVHIARNTEAFVFVALVVVCLAVSGSSGFRWAWPVVLLAIYIALVIGSDSVPGEIATLKESFLAAAIVATYLAVTRSDGDEPRTPTLAVLALVSVALIAGELPGAGSESPGIPGWLADNAETWAFVGLTVILIDVLWPFPWLTNEPASMLWHLLFLCMMIGVPVVVAVVNENGVDSVAAIGAWETSLVVVQRVTESFIAAFLLWFYAYAQVRLEAGLPKTEEQLSP